MNILLAFINEVFDMKRMLACFLVTLCSGCFSDADDFASKSSNVVEKIKSADVSQLVSDTFDLDDKANTSSLLVRLVVTKDNITFDGKTLSFDMPFKDWIEVLGDDYIQGGRDNFAGGFSEDRFIYPKLGLDIELLLNDRDPKSNWNNDDKGSLKDPFGRYVRVVRVMLSSHLKNFEFDFDKKRSSHVFNTMSASYAINFFGAIVDSHTPKSNVLDYSQGLTHSGHFNSIRTSSLEGNQASIAYNAFFGSKPEISYMIQIYPDKETQISNRKKYFGY
ncbi:hypothetical protein SAMN04488136_1362 [Vibrio xiamenensis]|uniref:DUF7738 domain-containing protein n=2 Tax=Vibrio xiamenensis TaxID=861298 RepID=A0A1G8GCW6_9VIBR|nr:hypothetical protein SAMN04488136_1362 [Vibrio xiamenensis]